MEVEDVEKIFGFETQNTRKLYYYKITIKRQCTDPEAFECTHGVTFR